MQKNKEDIEAHYKVDRVLAEFGITVIGQVDTASELDGIVGEKYGYAYAVGTSEPYSFYIWTRANNVSEEDYWFNIGQLAIVGPQGPEGPEGPQGPTGASTKWAIGSTAPTLSSSYNAGDLYLNYSTGDIYSYSGSE